MKTGHWILAAAALATVALVVAVSGEREYEPPRDEQVAIDHVFSVLRNATTLENSVQVVGNETRLKGDAIDGTVRHSFEVIVVDGVITACIIDGESRMPQQGVSAERPEFVPFRERPFTIAARRAFGIELREDTAWRRGFADGGRHGEGVVEHASDPERAILNAANNFRTQTSAGRLGRSLQRQRQKILADAGYAPPDFENVDEDAEKRYEKGYCAGLLDALVRHWMVKDPDRIRREIAKQKRKSAPESR